MNDLIDLKKKRNNLNIKIREMIWRDKDSIQIKQKVIEYLNITDKLISEGANIKRPKVLQFNPEYWDTHTTFDFKGTKPIISNSSQKNKNSPTVIIKEVQKTQQKSYFILNICWSDLLDTESNNTFNEHILPYLNYIGINKIKEDISEFEDHVENIRKCEYYGYEDDFNLLKKSISYIIQVNNITNMEYYGKKRN